MPSSNRWNRFIYACWSPFYDFLVKAPALARGRKHALELLALESGERVCLIGVGTGADLELLPEGIDAVGVDLSASMLAKAKGKIPIPGREIALQVANAEDLPFADDSFDCAVLTLIVSVAADGGRCMAEAARIVRPGGRILVFDKFLREGSRPSLVRRALNLLTRVFGTDINRAFEPMIAGLPLRTLKDEPALMNGAYRAILLEKGKHGLVIQVLNGSTGIEGGAAEAKFVR